MQIRTPVKKLTGERAVFLLPETVVFLHGRFLSRAIRASPSRKSDNSAVRAFTLIELLAAIAVIALLAALLFPLASRMIVKSQTSKCAANLRQIYSASLLWSQENYNAMLLTFPTLNPTPTSTWDQALRPYLGIDSTWPSAQNAGKRPPSVFACPASKSLTTLSRLSDYGKNAFVNNPYPVPTQGPAYRWAGFNSASKVIFLADARGRDLSPFVLPDALIQSRHDGKANVLFYDGHVELLNPSDPTQVPKDYTAPPWRPVP